MVQIDDVDDMEYELPTESTSSNKILMEPVAAPSPPLAQGITSSNAMAGANIAGPGKANVSGDGVKKIDPAEFKDWACLYPIYFDASRSVGEGRRVSRSLAVDSPISLNIAYACRSLGVSSCHEPTKTHPNDWANPGRVRVDYKREGRPVNSLYKSKRQLLNAIAKYLKTHPTTKEMISSYVVSYYPVDQSQLMEPAKPKGWKINKLLPLHSPAQLRKGGANTMKEMMEAQKMLAQQQKNVR